jgi:hypothetical protein
MLQEVPLIARKASQGGMQFEVCKEGLALLRTLRTKKVKQTLCRSALFLTLLMNKTVLMHSTVGFSAIIKCNKKGK